MLAGDVMTGRGIDQVLAHPGAPDLHESYVRDAWDYVRLAEALNGPIPAPVSADYLWGDALAEIERVAPDLRIVNLETAVTTSDHAWPGKGIHYRMHPANVGCLTAAQIDWWIWARPISCMATRRTTRCRSRSIVGNPSFMAAGTWSTITKASARTEVCAGTPVASIS